MNAAAFPRYRLLALGLQRRQGREQGLAVRRAQSRAWIPPGRGLVGAVIALGDVAEGPGADLVERGVDIPEGPAEFLVAAGDQSRPQRRHRTGTADHLRH